MFHMKLLLIACLVNHALGVALKGKTPLERYDRVRVTSKTAMVDVETKDGAIILTLKKNGYTSLHAGIATVIADIMDKAIETGAPVNPPIWWIAPNNTVAHKINDAYLLGEHILVAPVTIEGATSRDIYLPAGRWRDPHNTITYTGPIWIDDYPAPLHILPFFVREVDGTYVL